MAAPSAKVVPTLVDYIRFRVKGFVPEIGVICGSGLGHLAEVVTDAKSIEYKDLAPYGWPQSTVQGHGQRIVFGLLGGKRVMLLAGRFHYYEGYHPQLVAVPVQTMAALGCRVVVVTNAAGGVNKEYKVNDVMVITDQISMMGLAGTHPLTGPHDKRFGDRFPAVSPAFDVKLQDLVFEAKTKISSPITLRRGVYCGVAGPSYETPHEIKFIHTIGGDSVGMSTVFEIITAAHCGMKVLGLSMITNQCLHPGDSTVAPSHKEVLDNIGAGEKAVQALVLEVVANIPVPTAMPLAYTTFAEFKGTTEPAAITAPTTATACEKKCPRKCAYYTVGAVLAVAGLATAAFLFGRSSRSAAKK